MPVAHVLIVSSQSLFAESLRSLLEREGCDVIGTCPYGANLPNCVESLKPSVVVLDTQNVPPAATATLLECAPNIRIVRVSLEAQGIAVYEHQEPLASTVQDFLDFVAFRDRRPPEPDGPGSAE